MNVNTAITKDYEKRTLGERGKNKPNSNPIKPNQTQFPPQKPASTPKTNPICRGVALGEAGSNPILSAIALAKVDSKAKKYCGVCLKNFCERKQAKTGIDVNE